MKILRGEKFHPKPDVWVEEFRIKDLTPDKRTLINTLVKGRPLMETEDSGS